MRYHFFLHYGWFFQNLEKDFIPILLHTTVCSSSGAAMAAQRWRRGGLGHCVAAMAVEARRWQWQWRRGIVGGGVAAIVAAIEWRWWRGDGGGDATNFSEGD